MAIVEDEEEPDSVRHFAEGLDGCRA